MGWGELFWDSDKEGFPPRELMFLCMFYHEFSDLLLTKLWLCLGMIPGKAMGHKDGALPMNIPDLGIPNSGYQ